MKNLYRFQSEKTHEKYLFRGIEDTPSDSTEKIAPKESGKECIDPKQKIGMLNNETGKLLSETYTDLGERISTLKNCPLVGESTAENNQFSLEVFEKYEIAPLRGRIKVIKSNPDYSLERKAEELGKVNSELREKINWLAGMVEKWEATQNLEEELSEVEEVFESDLKTKFNQIIEEDLYSLQEKIDALPKSMQYYLKDIKDQELMPLYGEIKADFKSHNITPELAEKIERFYYEVATFAQKVQTIPMLHDALTDTEIQEFFQLLDNKERSKEQKERLEELARRAKVSLI